MNTEPNRSQKSEAKVVAPLEMSREGAKGAKEGKAHRLRGLRSFAGNHFRSDVSKHTAVETGSRKPEVRSQRSAFCLLSSALALLAFAAFTTSAIEDPPGCSLANGGAGNTSQGGINFSLSQAHVGDAVSVFPNLGMANNACRAINATGVVYIATGPLTNFLVNVTLNPNQLVVCPNNALCQPGPYSFVITPALVGAAVDTPAGSAPATPGRVRAVETGFGDVLAGDSNEQLSDFHTASIQIVNPCLKVVATCDLAAGQTCFLPDQVVRFRGYLTNCGDITVTNVAASDSRAGALQLFNPTNGAALTGNIILPPGGYAVFSNSFLPSLAETCGGAASSVITATARDVTTVGGPNAAVTNSFLEVCGICVQPAIVVTKTCPPSPVPPGGVLTFSGTVTNTGNITLTNVTITSDRVLTNGSALVASYATLAKGEFKTFTGSYLVPTNACALTDTLTARGTTPCGTGATNTATATCAVTNTARITVTKNCPAVPVVPGELATISGVVSNSGNVTLTNVTVMDNVPTVPPQLVGPSTLAPGQAIPFSGTYRVPRDVCTYFDTVTASGTGVCPGGIVTDTATAICSTATDPRLAITKLCPDQPVSLGKTMVFSGTVSNAGNITLSNVVVINTQPTNNHPLLGPISLAPGEQADFTGSYLVPVDTCASNILDTVTARGIGLCEVTNVTASLATSCPILPVSKLVVTKNCPVAPVPLGGLLAYSGTVSNAGTITLTNVMLVNNQPTNNTPILGPFTLAPNQTTNFSGSYFVCADCCPPYVDTLRATGAQICNGSNVTGTATASCPGLTQPQLGIVVDCPPSPAAQGQLLFYSGTVSNAGDVALGSVILSDNRTGFVTQIPVLAPAETSDFFGFYLEANCGPAVATAVTATALDLCTGGSVSNQVSANCSIACSGITPPVLLNPAIAGGQFKFSFAAEAGRTYTVQCSDAVQPVNWQPLTNFPGTGGLWTYTAPASSQKRFYRVQVQSP